MERVQFQQEQMLAELKDLTEKGIFTQSEVKQIMKKRTAFETALVRRIPKKGDFLRYAAYEMGLEALRRKRVERLNLQKTPPSISDYALVRRQFHIFERALKKFKGDVGLWIQYLQVAKKERARALVGRISARALQLHPNTPALYVIAASHELEHLSPASARTLLQRGLRLNSDSVELWREYVKMELGFMESLRRRWSVLGISVGSVQDTGKPKADTQLDDDSDKGSGTLDLMEVDTHDSEAARREVLEGAIVKTVITNAVKAIPKLEAFIALRDLLSTYPSPLRLRQALLDHLHALLHSTLPSDPHAVKVYCSRHLTPGLEGEDLISALKTANQELVRAVNDATDNREPLASAYVQFVAEWCRKEIDANLRLCLVTCLQSLAKHHHRSPSLLAGNIQLLLTGHPSPPAQDKILRLARKYTAKQWMAGEVWFARLQAEEQYASAEEVAKAWAETRDAVKDHDVERVWMWGFEQAGWRAYPSEERRRILEQMLKESMRDSSLASVHEKLIIQYVSTLHSDGEENFSNVLSHIAKNCLPTEKVWSEVFTRLGGSKADIAGRSVEAEKILSEVYEKWKTKNGLEASLAWAAWLLEHGNGKKAKEVIGRTRSVLSDDDRSELDRRWAETLDKGNVSKAGTNVV
ncbi:hypothetical protein JAAARDRAFT_35378 [Jaapia argillacea MUCL 33604]|uniref:U3 small nucleolar RNA-associated protein 6 N-terminal domain-containing protein n=1 Tax=Jaapia argillacea MUCL 33604 TaxID=933084 RepID=A0A067PSA1_9AGAM|nr:hypothetical protein JAAARDRAFT_35378 [Jaapia argillacea MUCL 33604]